MSRYIDADAIVDKVCEGISCNECSFGTNEDGMSECVLQKRIDGLPTADVVEVVRCKDCRYWQEYQEGHYPNELCPWDKNETTDEDDYCSYGERKEDEQIH